MTTNVEDLNQIKDINGDTIAYYNEDADVIDAQGETFGFIDENNNVCTDADGVIASLNDDFVVEDEDEANAIFALASGEQVSEAPEAGTEIAEVETAEVADADPEEELEENVTDNITIEEIDQYIAFLHDRGLPMEDVLQYPKEAIDIENPPAELLGEDGNFKQEFIESHEYSLAFYRAMIDQVMDILAPRLVTEEGDYVYDENGIAERSFKRLIANEAAIVYTFDQDSMKALAEVVEKAKNQSGLSLDVETLMETLDGLTKAVTDKEEGLLARAGNLASSIDVKKWAQYVKDNPGKAAGVGAATAGGFIVAGPVGAAAGGAAAAGGGSFLDRFRKNKEEDPDIQEMLALRKQLEIIEKQAPGAYAELDKSIEIVDGLRDQNDEMKTATLITHRRCCVYIAAAETLLELMETKIIPEVQKLHEEHPENYSYKLRYEDTVNAFNTLNTQAQNMTAGLAEGQIDIAAGQAWSDTLKELKSKMNAHKASKPRLDMQVLRAKRALETTDMAKLVLALDALRDNALEVNTQMGESTARIAIKASKRTVTSIEALESSAKTTGATRAALESAGSKRSTAKDRRKLLESVSQGTSSKAPKRKLLGSTPKEEEQPKGKAKRPRRSLTEAQNNAANGNTPEAEQPKAKPGARRRNLNGPK